MSRYFEDFVVGDVYLSRLGRTITQDDNAWFTFLTNNTNQIHFNEHYAKASGLDRCLVNSALTMSVVAGLTVVDVSENGINLGWSAIELPSPVFPGDTLYARTKVISTRASKSRPGMGLVEVETEGLNQKATCVIRYRRTVLVWRREHAPNPLKGWAEAAGSRDTLSLGKTSAAAGA